MAQNQNITIFSLGVRTVTADSPVMQNIFHSGVEVVLNVTAVTSTPSVVVKIQARDIASGAFYDLLTSAAVTTTGIKQYLIYPGISMTTGEWNDRPLPREFRVRMEHANANAITYSVGACLLV